MLPWKKIEFFKLLKMHCNCQSYHHHVILDHYKFFAISPGGPFSAPVGCVRAPLPTGLLANYFTDDYWKQNIILLYFNNILCCHIQLQYRLPFNEIEYSARDSARFFPHLQMDNRFENSCILATFRNLLTCVKLCILNSRLWSNVTYLGLRGKQLNWLTTIELQLLDRFTLLTSKETVAIHMINLDSLTVSLFELLIEKVYVDKRYVTWKLACGWQAELGLSTKVVLRQTLF